MPTNIPGSKPRLSAEEPAVRIRPFGIDRTKNPVIVVGVRGYYKDMMGAPGVNDRGIYDDAILIDTPSATIAYNGNTDPSRVRKGRGTGAKKGMASLKPGLWMAHKFDKHNGEYEALCQRTGQVTVVRDGDPPYDDTGMFGINIHRGSRNSTSSAGCQTLHPDQSDGFISTVKEQAKRYFGTQWNKVTIPYVLLEN